jgi:hypothetical protein
MQLHSTVHPDLRYLVKPWLRVGNKLHKVEGVRNCRIKTTTHVEKKDLLGTRLQDCNGLAEMDSGLSRRGQAMGEGESLWPLIICDHQLEQINMPG